MPGLRHYDNQNADPSNTVYAYILSDYVPKINIQDEKLLKYFPNEMLTKEQIPSAEIGRLKEEQYILKKIGVGKIDLKDGKPVQQSQIDEVDRKIAEIRNRNGKFSLREDSSGTELTKEQQDYFADSKVRDENGQLMVMYHDTPNGSYDRFRSGTYLTFLGALNTNVKTIQAIAGHSDIQTTLNRYVHKDVAQVQLAGRQFGKKVTEMMTNTNASKP